MSEMTHSFTVKGYIERGSPHISWSVNFIHAESIDSAIALARAMFTEVVMVSDVTRIMSAERGPR
jgi:hypothetical protein